MNIWELYKAAQYLLNKNQRGNALSVDEFNSLLPLVGLTYFKLKVGLPEEYMPGRPIPRQAWENSQKITDDLRLVEVNMGGDTPPLYVNDKGFANLPPDYIHQSTAHSQFGDIEFLNSDDFSGRKFKQLKKPTLRYAVCRVIGDRLEFMPKNINSVNFSYLRLPKMGYLDVKIVNDVEQYLPEGEVHDGSNTEVPLGSGSRTVQPEWPEQTHQDLVNLIVSLGSKNLRDGSSYQIAEAVKQKGM